MDIDEFYEADPRRRPSAEIELGTEWQDAHGVRYELNYVEDTGELYVMQEPPPHVTGGPLRRPPRPRPPGYEDKMTVHVMAKIDSVDELHTILEGWQEAMTGRRTGPTGWPSGCGRPAWPSGRRRATRSPTRLSADQVGRRQLEHGGQELGGQVVGPHVRVACGRMSLPDRAARTAGA